MRETLKGLFRGSMRGRTMYVIPFSMGPVGSPIGRLGIEITDSPYVVVNMRIMTRMGSAALAEIVRKGEFVPAVHTVGAPLDPGEKDCSWPCDSETKYIVHFPETREIWSYGSGYGGNALLGKKCLRPPHRLGHRPRRGLAGRAHDDHQSHLAGRPVKHMAGAFPSACGKTNLAMLEPTIPGWKVETIGDDICWMKFGADGTAVRHQSRDGVLRRRARHVHEDQRQRHPDPVRQLHLHQLRPDRRWRRLVGGPDRRSRPLIVIDWTGKDWTPASAKPAAHPNARFTAPARQNPAIAPIGRTRPAFRSTRSCSAAAG